MLQTYKYLIIRIWPTYIYVQIAKIAIIYFAISSLKMINTFTATNLHFENWREIIKIRNLEKIYDSLTLTEDRGPWFKSYTGLKWISLGTRISMRLLNWYPKRAVSVQLSLIFLDDVCWLQTNREWNSFPGEIRMVVSYCSPMTREVKMSKGGWMAKSLPKTGNFF